MRRREVAHPDLLGPDRHAQPVAVGRPGVPGHRHRELGRDADRAVGVRALHQVAGADEAGGEDRGRVLVDVLGRAALLDHAVVHDRDPVAHAQRLVLVVGDEQEGDPDLALDRLQLDLHRPAQLEVEGRERLVEQQHLRPVDQRAGERDALSLAAGELGRPVLGARAELHQLEHLADALVDAGAVDALAAQAERDVAAHVEVLEERVALEDGVDVALVRRGAGDVVAADLHGAGGGVVEAGDHPQRGGLAAARRAQQREELAGRDVEVDVVDDGGAAELLGQAAQRHGRSWGLGHRRSPPVIRSRLDVLRLNRRGSSSAATISRPETSSIRVPTALMDGEMPNRIEE